MKRYVGYIIGVLAILFIFFISSYNSLIKKQEKMQQMWSEVQNTYQRRLDLTPNLVNTVKGVSEFEQTTLVKIAEARSNAMQLRTDELTAENYNTQAHLQDTLAAASNRMIAVIEKYPKLKGTAAYRGLQTQLEGNERRIKVARNDFNAAVADYNKSVRIFPKNIVASMAGFKVKEGFIAKNGAENNIEIKI